MNSVSKTIKTVTEASPKNSWMRGFTASPQHVVIGIGCAVFILGLVFKIHFSSIGMWNSYLHRKTQIEGLVYGTPQAIRSDEWMLGVPWLLSQAKANPPWTPENPAVGPGTSALLVGLPTSHWSALLRPAHWGFYLFDIERGFSWLWMWRSVVPCVALLVLVLELTGGSYLLAITATAWIFFSGFVQWWLASVAEMLAYWTLACLSLRYIFVSTGTRNVLAAATGLLLSAGGFGLSLYPPFQVPLAYLGVALTPFLLRGAGSQTNPKVWRRLLILCGPVCLGFGALWIFMKENAAAIAIMGNTVYPGHRVSLGGDLSLWRFISGLFESTYTYTLFPPIAGNICEASSFLFLWPITLLLVPFFTKRGEIVRFVPLIVYLVLFVLWGVFGISESVALVTGLSFVPTTRAFLGWGVGGALLSVLVMCQPTRISRRLGSCYVAGIIIGLIWCATEFSTRFPTAIPLEQFYRAVAAITVAVIALVFRRSWLLAGACIVLCVVPHSQVNPMMRGLDTIVKDPLVRAVARFDPQREGRWAVFGSAVLAQLVKVSGRSVINGSQYMPDIPALRKLDPEQNHLGVYNRYALVAFTVAPEGTPPLFNLLAPDTWELQVDPCHEKFRDFGVRYMVWSHYSSQRRFSCYERVYVGADFAIYKSKESKPL